MKTNVLMQERGSVLIEVVAFAAVGFGLVLTLGFQLLEQERRVLELQSLTRNSMRAYLLSSSNDIFEQVNRFQSKSKLWAEERISVSLSCTPSNCFTPNTLIWLEISGDGLNAKAFGVRGG